MMNIAHDIITLKEQGVSDLDIVKLIKLKGAKEEEIISQLNEFYTNKKATQVTEEPLTAAKSSLPVLQIVILVLLFIIAIILGIFIFQKL